MIQITDKKDCCGCGACVQRCPKSCIAMVEDTEGFFYPQIDPSLCINCGLCIKVCPVINQNVSRHPLNVFAAKNKNIDVRLTSSSGGIFTCLSEKIIDEGGVVFGVGFNKHWEAVHQYTETKEGLVNFRGSKYIQSNVRNTYKETELFLKQGRKVLYSGTPCQIAGLKKFLRRDYKNLITIDFICHGTPSPGIFRLYLGELLVKLANSFVESDKKYHFSYQEISKIPKVDILAKDCDIEIKGIRFRDKKQGWKRFSFAMDFIWNEHKLEPKIGLFSETAVENVFTLGFLSDLYLRPSCYECPCRKLKSGSDITIGDFWGIYKEYPDYDDDKGVSAVLTNTDKGQNFFNSLSIDCWKTSFDVVVKHNPALVSNSLLTRKRSKFYNKLDNNLFTLVDSILQETLLDKIIHKVKRLLKRVYFFQKFVDGLKRKRV